MKKKLLIIGIFLGLLAATPSVYFYIQYRNAQAQLSDPATFAKKESDKLISALGKLMELPTDETPTVSSITDRDKLATQPFFAKAENGDTIFIYTNAKKAILYRSSTNKIIEVAAINLDASASAVQVSPTQAPVATRLVLYNGTDVVGLTSAFEKQVKEKVDFVDIVDRDTAKKRDYETSVLVDVTGTKKEELQKLSQTLGITIGTLPEGEATPEADFLIIVGADQK